MNYPCQPNFPLGDRDKYMCLCRLKQECPKKKIYTVHTVYSHGIGSILKGIFSSMLDVDMFLDGKNKQDYEVEQHTLDEPC